MLRLIRTTFPWKPGQRGEGLAVRPFQAPCCQTSRQYVILVLNLRPRTEGFWWGPKPFHGQLLGDDPAGSICEHGPRFFPGTISLLPAPSERFS